MAAKTSRSPKTSHRRSARYLTKAERSTTQRSAASGQKAHGLASGSVLRLRRDAPERVADRDQREAGRRDLPGGDACFFFQAEDGIRDHCVTGVQTCALPISRLRRRRRRPRTSAATPAERRLPTARPCAASGCADRRPGSGTGSSRRAGAASSRPSRSKCRAERTAPPVRNGGPRGAGPLPCGSKGRGSGPRPSTQASCLEREPRLRVPACALDAMRRSHGHRIGGAQEREPEAAPRRRVPAVRGLSGPIDPSRVPGAQYAQPARDKDEEPGEGQPQLDVRLNSSHTVISYAVFCLKKKKKK